MWNNPRARAAVDCREMDRGDVREKIVMGNVKGVVESREYTRILGPQRRRIQSGARDEA